MDKVTKPSMKPSLKRRVGYLNEGISTTRTKLAQMKIAEENEEGTQVGLSEGSY
jgi:hypothetical protein